MNKSVCFLLFFITQSVHGLSQVLPEEGRILNYRLIGFSFPARHNAHQNGIEIAIGNFSNEDSFKSNVAISLPGKTNKIIAEVPYFGRRYTWRSYTNTGTTIIYSGLHHFSTGMIPSVDTNVKRLRILKTAEQYKDAYVFIENNRALYDMNGHAVWYLPDIGNLEEEYPVRDMKLTPQGTITLLAGQLEQEGYEINYNGAVLWKAPQDSEEHYHHEFTRLSNGNYMILGRENVNLYLSAPTAQKDSGLKVVPANKLKPDSIDFYPGWQFYRKDQFPKIIEYDATGNLVWEYGSSRYFDRSDLYFHKDKAGNIVTKVHDNGFYFDEKAKELYISCKDISRIIKVKYPEGNTLNAYGEKFSPGAVQNSGKGFFCGQHSCRLSENGGLYLFNNNVCNKPALPAIVIMQQPATEKDSLKKVWEYPCVADELNEEEQKKLDFTSGGSVCELPGHSWFIDMGGQYSKVFIINSNKEILWSALPEKWDKELNKWIPFPQYRASIITNRADLERLIWNVEKK